jgi:transcription elongation factor Elf1
MRSMPYDDRAAPKAAPEKPGTCPFCRSLDLSTTSKAISAETYWRCAKCGQIWNQSRLLASRRY